MVIYKKTFENTKVVNCNFPVEDQFYADDSKAIIADGITRDPIGISDFSTCSSQEITEKYPRPSGAEMAAKAMCETFSKVDGTLIEKLVKCNETVKELNNKYIQKCDYLENDYYAAVASCISIENDILNYAYIGDCGIIVYDKFGNIKLQTEDDKELYSDPYIKKLGLNWDLPETRVIVRKEYRNNLANIQDGKCVSYGAITGEEAAIEFIKQGKVKLEQGDMIAVYSDGFVNFLHNQEFIKQLLNFNNLEFENYINTTSLSNHEKYGKEKTILVYKV